jgi:hypothetical protein
MPLDFNIPSPMSVIFLTFRFVPTGYEVIVQVGDRGGVKIGHISRDFAESHDVDEVAWQTVAKLYQTIPDLLKGL